MKLAAVVLAGGEGSRIGGGKPFRELAGKSLLERATDKARAISDKVAVAVRNHSQVGNAGLPLVIDEPGIPGPLAGLVSSLRYARNHGCDALLTLPADMPFLSDDLAERLEKALGESGAAIAASGGHLHPVCGLWRVDALDFVADYLASGRRSLKGFAELVGFAAVEWPDDPADPFFNINSPEDLIEAERRLLA